MTLPIVPEQTTALKSYDAAVLAIAEALSIDEVKNIKDKAEAMRQYAKQSKNFETMNQASAIRLRAEYRMGEMLREQKEAGLMNKGGGDGSNQHHKSNQSHCATSSSPTLEEVGLTKSMSSRAQKLAEIPKEDFDTILDNHLEDIEEEVEITRTLLVREYASTIKKEEIADIKSGKVIAPEGLYDVIVLDPPWEMKKIERDVRPNQVEFDYPTMTEDELMGLDIPFNDSCHVFTWTTQKHLPSALRLIESWGMKYVLTMVWHKTGGPQPFGLPQYNCEFIIYARVGTPSFIDTKAFPVCFNAPRGKHSEKPEEFYDVIRRVTGGRRIDMFNRRDIEGFDSWGNEA